MKTVLSMMIVLCAAAGCNTVAQMEMSKIKNEPERVFGQGMLKVQPNTFSIPDFQPLVWKKMQRGKRFRGKDLKRSYDLLVL